MTMTPVDQRTQVLASATSAVRARMRAEVDLLVAAAEWARLHPATEATGYAGFGVDDLFGEQLTPLAGQGAPLVAEFAPAELAAVLGWSTETVKQLMADALELCCRLPKVWADVLALRLPVPVARYLAEQTHDLHPWSAHRVDQLLAGQSKLTRPVIKRVVDAERLYADPDRAVAEEENALAARRVELYPGSTPATGGVEMSLDLADQQAFGATVAALAEIQAALGDTDPLDVRRARAVGIMADPALAARLLAGDVTATQTPRRGKVELALRLDLTTLAALALDGTVGPVDAKGYGVATTALVKDWLTGWLGPQARITVRPYLDLTDPDSLPAVDAHDPSEAMARFVRLRDPVCVFPGCTRNSERCDLDHIEPYVPPDDGGPPGQTHLRNLAPLCRHHHRVKTHGRWTYHRLPGGGFRWTTPSGQTSTSRSAAPDSRVAE